MELAATLFTVTCQIPVNRAVGALDPGRLAHPAAAEPLRAATLQHFPLLSLSCLPAFLWLLFVVVLSASTPRLQSEALLEIAEPAR